MERDRNMMRRERKMENGERQVEKYILWTRVGI